MNKTLLLFALMLSVPASSAEIMNCNVSGNTLFTLINLDAETKSASMTDTAGKVTEGKITLIRGTEKGRNKFNVSLEYRFNNAPTHIDLIITPVLEEEYSVGMAGYIKRNGKQLLELAANDKAMCF